jgi:hypothetical protein
VQPAVWHKAEMNEKNKNSNELDVHSCYSNERQVNTDMQWHLLLLAHAVRAKLQHIKQQYNGHAQCVVCKCLCSAIKL